MRQVTGWLTRRPKSLTEDERLELKTILDRSDVLTTTHQHVRGFAEMLTTGHGERLGEWMRDVDAHGSPALRYFVAGLRTDLDAVTAGLTLDYSSGAVEGTVNRIKMNARCSAAPASTYYASESSIPPDHPGRRQHGMCANPLR